MGFSSCRNRCRRSCTRGAHDSDKFSNKCHFIEIGVSYGCIGTVLHKYQRTLIRHAYGMPPSPNGRLKNLSTHHQGYLTPFTHNCSPSVLTCTHRYSTVFKTGKSSKKVMISCLPCSVKSESSRANKMTLGIQIWI